MTFKKEVLRRHNKLKQKLSKYSSLPSPLPRRHGNLNHFRNQIFVARITSITVNRGTSRNTWFSKQGTPVENVNKDLKDQENLIILILDFVTYLSYFFFT